MCANFQLKMTTLTFWVQICPKRKLRFEIQKTNVGIRISMLEIPCVPIFRQNGHLWLFGPTFAQKWILGSKFQKCKSGFRISILEILCVPIFRQKLWIFGPKFAPFKKILGSKFQKSKSGFGISILEILCGPIFRQNGQLCIFGAKFAQKWNLGSKFQKSKSWFGINTFNIPFVPIFSQNGQLLIFLPKFREIAQLRAIFWSKYCGWYCRELDGGWNELGGGGLSWVEVDGAAWRWVHGLVIPEMAPLPEC